MLETIKQLIKDKDLCVLATISGDAPHCSLMNYVSNDDCTELYMVTQKNTTKYKNLIQNNSVSLLVDTREDHPGPHRSEGKAITIKGVFLKLEDDQKKEQAKQKFLERHPYVTEIIEADDSEIICIKVRSFLLLDGFTNAYFVEI